MRKQEGRARRLSDSPPSSSLAHSLLSEFIPRTAETEAEWNLEVGKFPVHLLLDRQTDRQVNKQIRDRQPIVKSPGSEIKFGETAFPVICSLTELA